jgi:APA family basic amino acid/polyamine antiporter
LNHRNVPARAIGLQAGIATLIAITLDFNTLLIYIGFTLNIFAALTVLSLFRLRREGRSRIKICVGYPIPPLIFLGFTIWMTVWSIQEQPVAAFYGVLTLASGYILYLFRAKQARLVIDAVE